MWAGRQEAGRSGESRDGGGNGREWRRLTLICSWFSKIRQNFRKPFLVWPVVWFRTIHTHVETHSRHLSDFHLCHQCLDGDVEAIVRLQRDFSGPTAAYLIAAGAKSLEAAEVVGSLWADLLVPSDTCGPRLARYDGSCALKTWLNTVALNKLLTRKRNEKRWQDLIPARVGAHSDEGDTDEPSWGGSSDEAVPGEAPLIEIMRVAIETAFRSCGPEDFVLLQLKHCDRLIGAELAVMFDCDESAISRRIQKAEAGMRTATLRQVHQTDPWLELKWDDFMELCRSVTPSCFGLD